MFLKSLLLFEIHIIFSNVVPVFSLGSVFSESISDGYHKIINISCLCIVYGKTVVKRKRIKTVLFAAIVVVVISCEAVGSDTHSNSSSILVCLSLYFCSVILFSVIFPSVYFISSIGVFLEAL